MIVDSSVVVAICLGEADADDLARVLADADVLRMSAATLVETAVVLDLRAPGELDGFLGKVEIEIVPFDSAQASIARDVYRRYGKGSGHPAALNYGDCFSYALAAHTGEPLLFKGDDFTKTDVAIARK